MLRNEHRRKPQGLADLLLPFALIEDGILLQYDGSLMAGWSYRGPDTIAAAPAEMDALSHRLNSALRFGGGWMVTCDAVRSCAPGYADERAFPDPVTRLIDEERRQKFMLEGAHFESEYFLTLTYLPPQEKEERIKGWMFEGAPPFTSSGAAAQVLERFKSKVESFENVFGHLFSTDRLKPVSFVDDFGREHQHDQLLRYLRRCITGMDHPFALPEIPVFLNDVLACADFCGGIEPRIGGKRLAVIAVDGFPRASWPGILSALDSLALEYRWNTRAILMDPEEAAGLFETLRRTWRGMKLGWWDQLMRTQNGPINLHAANMEADAQQAMGIAQSGDMQFALYSSNVICLDEDRDRLHESARQIMKTVQNIGFSCRLEDVNAIEAWRGSLPGDGYSNVRRVPLHTLNLADMLPITSVWAGLRENPSALMPKNSPPLLYAATTGATPFRFHLHVSDLGHTIVVGPSSAGKSTLLGLIAAQWFRYPNAQVFFFDKGYSSWVLTHAVGGEFYDLAGPKSDLAFCPLHDIDSDSDLAWAVGWIESLCELNGLRTGPKHRNAITEAMRRLQASPARTMTEFSASVQDEEIRAALEHFTLSGAMGFLLDADRDCLGRGRMLAFETEHLLQLDDKAVLPVLFYLFRRIEQRLDGSPTLIVLDEAWAYLAHELFERRIGDWLRTMRRKNAVVVMATQQLADLADSKIAPVILDNCPTKIFLPNAEARSSRDVYGRLGLKVGTPDAPLDRELDLLRYATPKMQYYVVSQRGRRLIDLGLGPAALAFTGVNGTEERTLAAKVMLEYPEAWRAEWLRLKGLPEWARYLESCPARELGREVSGWYSDDREARAVGMV
jgi:type IV secretion system protein TrbE